MDKLYLCDVTLVAIDDKNTQIFRNIIEAISIYIDFGDIKIFTSKVNKKLDKYVTKINPINNICQYNRFVIKELYKYINTSFVMIIQPDGYPINIKAWTSEFLDYDYIGAPWIWAPQERRNEICPAGSCVGNGGFSIRSKKLIEMVACEFDYESYNSAFKRNKVPFQPDSLPEDVYICKKLSKELKQNGIKFAPCELAKYFSVENAIFQDQFGFHGKETIKINQEANVFQFEKHFYE
tara:strand:+ start:57 stop:767 length:711 start_codon:yes stop_codon:yes gene_type:complete